MSQEANSDPSADRGAAPVYTGAAEHQASEDAARDAAAEEEIATGLAELGLSEKEFRDYVEENRGELLRFLDSSKKWASCSRAPSRVKRR